jgi:hypothetical protein
LPGCGPQPCLAQVMLRYMPPKLWIAGEQ